MKDSDLRQLFHRYLSGKASPEDVKLLLRLFGKQCNEDMLKTLIHHQLDQEEKTGAADDRKLVLTETYHAIKKQIEQEGEINKQRSLYKEKYRWGKYAAAAAVMLLMITAFFFLRRQHKTSSSLKEVAQHKDIAPGGNKAVLTLVNGKKIILDSTKKGLLSLQGNAKVIKPGNGLLTYSSVGKPVDRQVQFNTITTPKGGQYEIMLSDGTKVWLNAGSSLRFPTAFAGKRRVVEVTGEAYFEVKTDKDHPFFVKLPPASLGGEQTEVKVLGTHFDVMTYGDELYARVTLLEGSVKVTSGDKNILLKQGEQVQIDGNGNMTKVKDVDLQGAVAWKNNYFYFEDDNIHAVMRQLARWYDVHIIIQGNIPQHFGGYISRGIYISKVFDALSATSHLEYRIRNDTIIVSP